MNRKTRVRFAPSPTGMLHIGGARTALFNYLFARNQGGKYLLRIEDTDKERSTDAAKKVILDGLKWLGLPADEEPVLQSEGEKRHADIAKELVDSGKAYYCYASKEELAQLREQSQAENKRFKYDRRWRDKDPSLAPKDQKPVIRIKAPLDGHTIFNDAILGEIKIPNQDQDDFVILRADGTPTYMLAVVVDDHDMEISHVIRGDDHLTNAAKQILIYQALNWEVPKFAHIPLIYGTDGKKLSKRHGATSATEYEEAGYLPEAMRNYLLRLGFAHGDAEIISDEQAKEWFNLEAIGKSPARFDFKKLDSLNAHYIKVKTAVEISKIILSKNPNFSAQEQEYILKLADEFKSRAINLNQLSEAAEFLKSNFIPQNNFTEKAAKIFAKEKNNLAEICKYLENIGEADFKHDLLYEKCKIFAEERNIKLGNLAQLLRVCITGSHASPSIFEIIEVFGKSESLRRLGLVSI